MNESSVHRIWRIAMWLFAVFTLALGALLCAQAILVYQAGIAPENIGEGGVLIKPIFTRHIALSRLSGLSWAFAIWIISCVAVSFSPVTPKDSDAYANEFALARMEDKGSSLKLSAAKRKLRISQYTGGAACVFAGLPAVIYLFDANHFTSWDLESVMGAMLLRAFPWIGIMLMIACLIAHYRQKLASRAVAAARALPNVDWPARKIQPKRTRPFVQIALIAVAGALILLGVLNGGMRDVLIKATNICTECIGLG